MARCIKLPIEAASGVWSLKIIPGGNDGISYIDLVLKVDVHYIT